MRRRGGATGRREEIHKITPITIYRGWLQNMKKIAVATFFALSFSTAHADGFAQNLPNPLLMTRTNAAPAPEAPHPNTAQYQPANQVTQEFCAAARNGNFQMMTLLTKQGADLNNENCVSFESVTPLMRSVSQPFANLQVMQFLLDNGADANYQTKNGQDALMFLLKQQWSSPFGSHAVANFLAVALPALVQHGANVNAADIAGNTPLMYLISSGYNMYSFNSAMYALNYLVSHGADVNHQNNVGQTPLMLASKGCGVQGVEHLLALGADPTIKDAAGNTALSLATAEASQQTSAACNQVVTILMNPAAYKNTAETQSVPAGVANPPQASASAAAAAPTTPTANPLQGLANAIGNIGRALSGQPTR